MVHQGLTRRHGLLAAGSLLLGGCAATAPRPTPVPANTAEPLLAPPTPREFRAAWVATVANIDWPSRKGLSRDEQIAEIVALCERAAQLRLNALIVQVRTSCDALYASALEPWSEYLSGTQGQDPGYDPLAVWVREAHARGLELHAWFNPYRARQSSAVGELHATHLANTQPGWVKRYGKQLWLDPGEPEAAAHSLAVYRDVLSRYEVDGLHIDDYFYPYPEKDAEGREVPFPDDESHARHGEGLPRADWRRRNVDRLVQAMHALVRELRPQARLGISPFGLMRPDQRPPGIQGFSQYDQLYADVERWLAEGWLDYLVPQLYWPMAQTAQAFGPLLSRWLELNPRQRHVYAGLYTSRINATPQSWAPQEILGQVQLTRALHPEGGHVHFSMAALMQDRQGVAAQLAAGPYAQASLPPAMPWLSDRAPPAPALQREAAGWRLLPAWLQPQGPMVSWVQAPDPTGLGSVRRALLWWREQGQWRAQLVDVRQSFDWPAGADALVASLFNATGVEGARRAWHRHELDATRTP
ncbi:glycoside hydrolase family 10 protein [Pseudorhodoferax sp.]|uniref:glycoside hydrolase family 10 protein n=1 Tax=Pseudorhodoferax sp. TaxID=1993553 RepID=UPI002DD6BA68|nr:family 10 glycosylhydrolase [Pseudorhodoferax sp.]